MLALQADARPRFSDNAALPPSLAGEIPPCRLMVVDDDEWIRTYVASILRSASYEVAVVDSGKEALRLLRAGSYDILLTDCLMPGMNGLALCQRVRAEFPDDPPYIVMFTVKDAREDRDAGLQSGADDYLIKGAPTSEVLAKINLGRRPLRRSSAPVQGLFHLPLCAADAARSRANIALWNSYLLSTCVRSMVRMGWDYTT
jgi:DNA-binding response OmpR family regulator